MQHYQDWRLWSNTLCRCMHAKAYELNLVPELVMETFCSNFGRKDKLARMAGWFVLHE